MTNKLNTNLTLFRLWILAIFVSVSAVVISAQTPIQNNAGTPARRALLVGLSEYNKTNKSFPDLPSVKNDLQAMTNLLRSPSYKFDVMRLENENATGTRILEEFERYLITEAKPGDISLFYFSGHGSQVRNSLGGESDNYDETFVPFDVIRPVKKTSELKDIRDKQINALLLKALAKGIKIIFIADSCHSGSIGRGDPEIRQLEPADFDIAEAPKETIKAGDRGAIIISAAQDFQRAQSVNLAHLEYEDFKHGSLGNFTANLVLTLYETPAELISSENLFKRVAAKMSSNGIDQSPDLDATPERMKKTLFGNELNLDSPKATIAVDGNKLVLAAGLAAGVSKGSEFVRVGTTGDDETEKPLRIRLINVGLNKSEFEIVANPQQPDQETPKAGEFFKQVTWGAPTDPNLTIWLPESDLTSQQLNEIVLSIDKWKDKIELTAEPSLSKPTHILGYFRNATDSGWRLEFPDGAPVTFAKFPSFEEIEKALKTRNSTEKVTLYVDLPPSADLVKQLNFSETSARSPIARSSLVTGANYRLSGRGRIVDGKPVVEYAWTLPAVFDPEPRRSDTKTALSSTALPPITDWTDASNQSTDKELKRKAQKLATIRGWLNLKSSPKAANKFPYRLEFRNKQGEKLEEGTNLTACKDQANCEPYKMYLVRTSDRCSAKFFVYVMAIDQSGASGLLHPKPGSNSPFLNDCVNAADKISAEILLNEKVMVIGSDVVINNVKYSGVLGVENFVLLITDQPITSRELLQFDGVRSANVRTGLSSLEFLLNGIGSESMSRDAVSTPDNWFVQQLTFRSQLK